MGCIGPMFNGSHEDRAIRAEVENTRRVMCGLLPFDFGVEVTGENEDAEEVD